MVSILDVMTQPRRTRMPREQRREQLLDVALGMIAGGGFGSLTMEGVARQAEIAKTVVYAMFTDLDGLIASLLAREQDRSRQAITAAAPDLDLALDPVALAINSISAMLRDVAERPDSWRLVLLTPDGAPPGLRETIECHRSALLRQMAPFIGFLLIGLGLDDVDNDLANHSILAGIENAARLIITDPETYPPERVIKFVEALAIGVAHRTP